MKLNQCIVNEFKGNNQLSPQLQKRWDIYCQTIENNAKVRNKELSIMLELINPQKGEEILEIGTGSGFLTIPIAKKIGFSGEMITCDINEDALDNLFEKTKSILPIKTQLFTNNYFQKNKFEQKYYKRFDKIISLATFHHFDNKRYCSGSFGRISILLEIYEMLKKGGKLILSDVVNNTQTQMYFDAIDNPYYFAPNGHPHDFFSASQLLEILKKIGFKDIEVKILEVPWEFNSILEAKKFFKNIHNAQCSCDESFEIAKNILGFKKNKNKYQTNWQLFFATAKK